MKQQWETVFKARNKFGMGKIEKPDFGCDSDSTADTIVHRGSSDKIF